MILNWNDKLDTVVKLKRDLNPLDVDTGGVEGVAISAIGLISPLQRRHKRDLAF